jgi:hypothetical protein
LALETFYLLFHHDDDVLAVGALEMKLKRPDFIAVGKTHKKTSLRAPPFASPFTMSSIRARKRVHQANVLLLKGYIANG